MVRLPRFPRHRAARLLLLPALAAFLCGGGAAASAQSAPNVEMADAVPSVAALPGIEVAATEPIVIARTGVPAVATFTRTGGSLSRDLLVYYSVTGTAKNGVDYRFIKGRLTIRSNKKSARLFVTPLITQHGGGIKTIQIKTRSNPAYKVGADREATLYISFGK